MGTACAGRRKAGVGDASFVASSDRAAPVASERDCCHRSSPVAAEGHRNILGLAVGPSTTCVLDDVLIA